MKSITKQLLIAAFILTSVTVLSFGIRQVRLGAYRADTEDSTPSARSSNPEDQSHPKQSLNTDAEPDHSPADSLTVDTEPDPQFADVSDWDEETSSDDYPEPYTDSVKHDKAVSMTKSFKRDYVKAEGKKGLEKISMGNNEDLYLTGEGEFWYVNEQPDGKTVKMQVQVDKTTGEMTIVGGGYYAGSEGSKGLQRISVGDREDLYLTGEGEFWYVSGQPDGSTAKVQLEEDIAGEITIVDNGKNE